MSAALLRLGATPRPLQAQPCTPGRPAPPALPPAAAAPASPPLGRHRQGGRPLRALAPPAAGLSLEDLQPETECSRAVYEATVLFLLQQDCDVQLQRALNKEDFELAQAFRAQRARVDDALDQLRAFRAAAAAGEVDPAAAAAASSSDSDSVDDGLAALRLRSDLAAAVEAEDYAAASRLRDELQALEDKAASLQNTLARAAEFDASRPPTFRLGQRVTHERLGWRGCVVGWDAACMEGADWQARALVSPEEAAGPCYHVLIDVRDFEALGMGGPDEGGDEEDGDGGPPPVAYVPEGRLTAPALPDTWESAHPSPEGSLDHPFAYLLFLGPDARGDMIPSRALRERYGAERRDVGPAS